MPSACSAFAFDAMLRSRICSYSLSIADAEHRESARGALRPVNRGPLDPNDHLTVKVK